MFVFVFLGWICLRSDCRVDIFVCRHHFKGLLWPRLWVRVTFRNVTVMVQAGPKGLTNVLMCVLTTSTVTVVGQECVCWCLSPHRVWSSLLQTFRWEGLNPNKEYSHTHYGYEHAVDMNGHLSALHPAWRFKHAHPPPLTTEPTSPPHSNHVSVTGSLQHVWNRS